MCLYFSLLETLNLQESVGDWFSVKIDNTPGRVNVISISNHMAVRVIWDISPELFFINFEITPSVSEGDFEIDEK